LLLILLRAKILQNARSPQFVQDLKLAAMIPAHVVAVKNTKPAVAL
jgi:hypothetical protein